jgi:hypothetical protein
MAGAPQTDTPMRYYLSEISAIKRLSATLAVALASAAAISSARAQSDDHLEVGGAGLDVHYSTSVTEEFRQESLAWINRAAFAVDGAGAVDAQRWRRPRSGSSVSVALGSVASGCVPFRVGRQRRTGVPACRETPVSINPPERRPHDARRAFFNTAAVGGGALPVAGARVAIRSNPEDERSFVAPCARSERAGARAS